MKPIQYSSGIDTPTDPVGDLSGTIAHEGVVKGFSEVGVTPGGPMERRRPEGSPPHQDSQSGGIVLLGMRFTRGRYPGWLNFSGLAAMLGMVAFYLLALFFGSDWYLLMGLCALAFLVLGILAPRVAIPPSMDDPPDETSEKAGPS